MIQRCLAGLVVVLVLGVTLALVWTPMRNETATVDETVFLGSGYSYWHGHRYYLNAEHPPLMQLWSAFPLLLLDVRLLPGADMFYQGQYFPRQAVTWKYNPEQYGGASSTPEGFYHYPAFEAGMYGRMLVYGGQNDADKLLFWGRFMSALVMLATGLLVFCWAKSLSNLTGGLLALVAWC